MMLTIQTNNPYKAVCFVLKIVTNLLQLWLNLLDQYKGKASCDAHEVMHFNSELEILCILSSHIQEAILACFPKIQGSTACNKPVVNTRFDWWGRSELFLTTEAIKVIRPAVSTHHQGLVRIVLLYWFWCVARSCLCPCVWQTARICFFQQERGNGWQQSDGQRGKSRSPVSLSCHIFLGGEWDVLFELF